VFTIVTLHGRQNASFLEKQGKLGKKQSLEKEQFGGDMLVLAS
jgi:hypothetical protein